nr:hypothetical protein [Ktedonobacter sp. SOSP1-52]
MPQLLAIAGIKGIEAVEETIHLPIGNCAQIMSAGRVYYTALRLWLAGFRYMPEQFPIKNTYGVKAIACAKVDRVSIGNGRVGNIIARSILERVFPEDFPCPRAQRIQITILTRRKECILIWNQFVYRQFGLERGFPISRAVLRVYCIDACLLHLARNLWAGSIEHPGIERHLRTHHTAIGARMVREEEQGSSSQDRHYQDRYE